MALIHSLDEDGYLADPIEDVAEALEQWQPCAGRRTGLAEPPALRAGLASALQPSRRRRETCLSACACSFGDALLSTQALALQLAAGRDGLDALARRDWRGLTQQLKVPERALQAARPHPAAEPKPGRRPTCGNKPSCPMSSSGPTGEGWLVQLNPEVAPEAALEPARLGDEGLQARGHAAAARFGIKASCAAFSSA